MLSETQKAVLEELYRGLERGEKLSIMEWAAKYRWLETGSMPGRFRPEIAPYVHGIAEALISTKPEDQTVVVKKGAQLTLSELAVNLIGWCIMTDPAPILYFIETIEKATGMMKKRIRPMLSRAPFNFPPPGKGTGENTRNEVLFSGGSLTMQGAGSSTAFSTNPARFVILDELARYKLEVDGEGDPLGLAKGRIGSYGGRGKIYIPSTPIEDAELMGSFETVYQSGDCREYYFPCPHCGEMDYARRERFGYILKKGLAWLTCGKCSKLTLESDKPYFLPRGEWRATKKRGDPGVAVDVTSFRAPGIIAPHTWAPWLDIAQRLDNAKKGRSRMQPVLNTCFGEGYSEGVENAEAGFIYKNHTYDNAKGELPTAALFVTLAVDTQKGWMRLEWKGHDCAGNSWSLKTLDINHGIETQEGRNELTMHIHEGVKMEGGGFIQPRVTAIDSGGAWAEWVYRFCFGGLVGGFPQPILLADKRLTLPEGRNVVVPVKGSNQLDASRTIMSAVTVRHKANISKRIGNRLFTIGTNKVKMEAYRAFNLDPAAAETSGGRALFPKSYDEGYFSELVVEKVQTKDVNGKRVQCFSDPPHGTRNEAFDTHCMNMMAAALVTEARNPSALAAIKKRAFVMTVESRPSASPSSSPHSPSLPSSPLTEGMPMPPPPGRNPVADLTSAF